MSQEKKEQILHALKNLLDKSALYSSQFIKYSILALVVAQLGGETDLSIFTGSKYFFLVSISKIPLIKSLIELIGGDLLAGLIEKFSTKDSYDIDQIEKILEEINFDGKIEEIIEGAIARANLLKEEQFWRAIRVLLKNQGEIQLEVGYLSNYLTKELGGENVENSTPNQLPSRFLVENFVNRQEEIKQLTSVIQPASKAIIEGGVGTGKSSLVVKTLWELEDSNELAKRFPDGVIYYDCVYETSLREISLTINQDFGILNSPDPNQLKRLLKQKSALIIFDNAERIIELENFLEDNFRCGILLTSQKKMEIEGERIIISELSDEYALQLISHLVDDKINASSEELNSLLNQLENLPLSITLASKYIKKQSMSLAAYTKWLERSLTHLELSKTKQRSFPLMMDSVFDQLSDTAIFIMLVLGNSSPKVSGSVTELTFQMAAYPKYDYEEAEIRRGLVELIDFHLVRIDKITTERGETHQRFNITHSLIHRYVREFASRKFSKVWSNILDRMQDLVTGPLSAILEAPPELQTFFDSSLYHDAYFLLENYVEAQRWDDVVACGEVLYRYSKRLGDFNEQEKVLKIGLNGATNLNDTFGQYNIQRELGRINSEAGRLDEAMEYLYQALKTSESREIVKHQIDTNLNIGLTHLKNEDKEKFEQYLDKALNLAKAINNQEEKFLIFAQMSTILANYSLFEWTSLPLEAIVEFEKFDENSFMEALIDFEEKIGLVDLFLEVNTELSLIYSQKGRVDRAIKILEYGLKRAQEEGKNAFVVGYKMNLGMRLESIGDLDGALRNFQDALIVTQKDQSPFSIEIQSQIDRLNNSIET